MGRRNAALFLCQFPANLLPIFTIRFVLGFLLKGGRYFRPKLPSRDSHLIAFHETLIMEKTMVMPNPYISYTNRLAQLNNQLQGDQFGNFMNHGQPIQPIQNLNAVVQQSAQCFFVNGAEDMERIQPNLNVVYVGLNKERNEVYLKKMDNNGVIKCNTYVMSSGTQAKNELATIMEKLSMIEQKVMGKEQKDERNTSNANATGNVGSDAKPSNDGSVQSNDEW